MRISLLIILALISSAGYSQIILSKPETAGKISNVIKEQEAMIISNPVKGFTLLNYYPGFNKAVDMWSFGVSLYHMAVAYLPTAIKQYKYGSGPIPFRICDWVGYDFHKLRDLIEECLNMDPDERITSKEALNHEWFSTL